MARPKRWEHTVRRHGILEVRLSSWKYFDDYVRQEMLDYRDYVWRGQRCSPWPLASTLDRVTAGFSARRRSQTSASHLRNFQYATRGRRGVNPPLLTAENDWWALGQHHGLSTPLLDWTSSPFVAAYFAFSDVGPEQTRRRAIFALDQESVTKRSDELATSHTSEDRPPVIEFVRPHSHENARLVNQGGLFTRTPTGTTIEEWIESHMPADIEVVTLLKLTVPNKDRLLCLRSLNRMNINHLTLFPDLYGASTHCNTHITIKDY